MRLFGAGTRPGQPIVERDTLWTVPNLLTILRFLGVPVFLWFIAGHAYLAAVLVLVIMAGTDWIDGYVARRFNQMSRVGKVLDPLADRIALLVVAVTLVVIGIAPLWLAVALIVPDLVLMAGSVWMFHGYANLPVSRIGKVRIALLVIGTPLLLLANVPALANSVLEPVAIYILMLGCLGHWIAAFSYWIGMLAKYRGIHENR